MRAHLPEWSTSARVGGGHGPSRWSALGVLAGGLALLILVGWGLAAIGRAFAPAGALTALDAGLAAYIGGRRIDLLTHVMLGFSLLADWWFVALLVLLMGGVARLRSQRWRGLWLPALAGGGAFAISAAVKLVTGRARPAGTFAIVEATGSAFPSGHAIRAIAVYGALAWLAMAVLRRRSGRAIVWVGAAAVVAGVGASRVYLGAHWLTDVLVGFALGAAWLGLVIAVVQARPISGLGPKEPEAPLEDPPPGG